MMKFRYNSKNFTIESDDPSVYVKLMGSPREEGLQFVLVLGNKRIGFQTTDDFRRNKSETLPDGTKVWRFDIALCRIVRWDDENKRRIEWTNTFRFEDASEQQHVLGIFLQAMAAYDGAIQKSEGDEIKARAEYTEDLLKKIANGNLLKR